MTGHSQAAAEQPRQLQPEAPQGPDAALAIVKLCPES